MRFLYITTKRNVFFLIATVLPFWRNACVKGSKSIILDSSTRLCVVFCSSLLPHPSRKKKKPSQSLCSPSLSQPTTTLKNPPTFISWITLMLYASLLSFRDFNFLSLASFQFAAFVSLSFSLFPEFPGILSIRKPGLPRALPYRNYHGLFSYIFFL